MCRFSGVVVTLLIAYLLSGCEAIQYYGHVSAGQMDMLWRREHINELINHPDTNASLKKQLKSVREIRQFASEQLGLPNNKSYSRYSDLERSHAVWNVFAASEFDVQAKQWCFWVVGCVAYRGYFDEKLAHRYANNLNEQGYDTYVAGIDAYSTLGWFDDPVLNTFVERDEIHLAALIFHELAHQQFYLAGDTAFSESFARAVEVEGVRRWLLEKSKGQGLDDSRMQAYLREQLIADDFSRQLLQLRQRLADLYQQALSKQVLKQRKAELIQDYQQVGYVSFKARWQTNRYDRWVLEALNNAKLVTVSSYYQWQPSFQQLLVASDYDWAVFYDKVARLASLDSDERSRQLKSYQIR